MNIFPAIILFLCIPLLKVTDNQRDTINDDLCQNYWGIPLSNLIQIRDSFPLDTIQMVNIRLDKIPSDETYLDFIKFNADGTFEEFKSGCGTSRKNYAGTWHRDSMNITVNLENNLVWHFEILSISRKKLSTVFSISK